MKVKEILDELRSMGKASIRHVYSNHGAPEHHLGVKIEDLKKIQKKIKKDYELSLQLYDSGISDAQYLAGLIADETRMTKKDLQHWVDSASWDMMNEYTVPWIAAESKYGWELALQWIDSKQEQIQTSGWSTLASIVAITADEDLDIATLRKLLKRAEKEIGTAGNRVKYFMNNFIISTGGYVKELTPESMRIANAIGTVTVDMGNTACKVPYAPVYIQKMIDRGVKKKKMARC